MAIMSNSLYFILLAAQLTSISATRKLFYSVIKFLNKKIMFYTTKYIIMIKKFSIRIHFTFNGLWFCKNPVCSVGTKHIKGYICVVYINTQQQGTLDSLDVKLYILLLDN